MSFRHPDTGEVTIHQDTGGDLVCDVSRYPTGSHYDVGTLMVLFAMPTYSVIGAHMCERQILYNRTGIYWCNVGSSPPLCSRRAR